MCFNISIFLVQKNKQNKQVEELLAYSFTFILRVEESGDVFALGVIEKLMYFASICYTLLQEVLLH